MAGLGHCSFSHIDYARLVRRLYSFSYTPRPAQCCRSDHELAVERDFYRFIITYLKQESMPLHIHPKTIRPCGVNVTDTDTQSTASNSELLACLCMIKMVSSRTQLGLINPITNRESWLYSVGKLVIVSSLRLCLIGIPCFEMLQSRYVVCVGQ